MLDKNQYPYIVATHSSFFTVWQQSNQTDNTSPGTRGLTSMSCYVYVRRDRYRMSTCHSYSDIYLRNHITSIIKIGWLEFGAKGNENLGPLQTLLEKLLWIPKIVLPWLFSSGTLSILLQKNDNKAKNRISVELTIQVFSCGLQHSHRRQGSSPLVH